MHEWYPNASLCGQFDFRTELELSSMAWDMDGDDAVIFVMDENNQPRLKLIEALQIGGSTSRAGSTARAASSGDTVKGGPYDGARIVNGVVLDRDDQFIGIQLKGSARGSRASSGGSPEDDSEIIPAYNCQLSFEPEFRFLHRGVPRIGKAMLDVFDGDDIDAFLKKAVKRLASFGVKIKTETGDAGPGGDLIVARPDNGTGDFIPPNDVKVEKIMGGEAYYMRANSGEDIEALKHDQPHPNTEAFVMRLERRAMLALRWFHELLDPSRIGGASVRLIQNQARTAIAKRQRTLKIRAKRCVQFAVAARMNSGQGSKNNDGADFLRWGFNMPPQLTVDQGYDELADQENFDLGSETLSSLCEKKGKWWLDRRGQKETENKDLIDRASVLVAYAKTKGQSLTFAEALDLMQRKNQTGRQRPAEADNPSPQTS
jgi:hypothetical protein